MAGKGEGDQNIKPTKVDGVDERQKAEQSATAAFQSDFHLTKPDAMKAVTNFEAAERQAGIVDPTKDLNSLVTRLDSIFKPSGPGGDSLWERMQKNEPHLAESLGEGMRNTLDLVKQVQAQFQTGEIKQGGDTPKAVNALLERLAHQKES
jgi:hypothetical protein